MELRKPVPTGTSSAMANDLQHEAAMRVQHRLDADDLHRRRLARNSRMRSLFSFLLLVLAVGGVGWAWWSGLLDSALDRGRKPTPGAVPDPASAAVPTGASKEAGSARPAPKPVSVGVAAPAVQAAATDLSGRFAGATVDYWKNAVAADKPGKDRRLTFTGLVPDGAGGPTFLEIGMGGGKPFSAKRLTPDQGPVEIDKAAFDRLIADTHYAVVREGRAYLCSPGKAKKAPTAYKVPPKGGEFNPARAEFGALADCLAAVKARRPSLKYKVSLEIEKVGKTLSVATVGYGDLIPRASFERVVRTLIDDAELIEAFLAAGKVRVQPAK